MKSIMRIVLGVLAIVVLCVSSQAQEEQGVKTKVFYGVNWESNIGFLSGACFDLPLGFKTYPYVRFGLEAASYSNGIQTDKTFGFEVGLTVKETPQYSLSLLAGASVDWTAPTDEVKHWTTYLPQSTGVLGTWTLPESTPLLNIIFPSPFGIAGWLKYRPQFFDNNTLWRDKVTAGVALFASI